MTKLSIIIGGKFGEEVNDEFISELKEDIEEELRWYWGASGVSIEVNREGE